VLDIPARKKDRIMTDIIDQATDHQQRELDARLARHRHQQQQAAARAYNPNCPDCGEDIEPHRRGRFPRCFQCQVDLERTQRQIARRA